MRISKDTARSASFRLTSSAEKIVTELRNEYAQLVREAYIAQQPKEVIEVFKKHPEYFDTTCTIYLDGCGFAKDSINVEGAVVSSGGNYNTKISLTNKIAAPLLKARDKWRSAKVDYEKLRNETEAALLTLRTTNRIKESLPVAAQYIPAANSFPLPAINMAPLNAKLKKLQPASK